MREVSAEGSVEKSWQIIRECFDESSGNYTYRERNGSSV